MTSLGPPRAEREHTSLTVTTQALQALFIDRCAEQSGGKDGEVSQVGAGSEPTE